MVGEMAGGGSWESRRSTILPLASGGGGGAGLVWRHDELIKVPGCMIGPAWGANEVERGAW